MPQGVPLGPSPGKRAPFPESKETSMLGTFATQTAGGGPSRCPGSLQERALVEANLYTQLPGKYLIGLYASCTRRPQRKNDHTSSTIAYLGQIQGLASPAPNHQPSCPTCPQQLVGGCWHCLWDTEAMLGWAGPWWGGHMGF